MRVQGPHRPKIYEAHQLLWEEVDVDVGLPFIISTSCHTTDQQSGWSVLFSAINGQKWHKMGSE